MEGERKFEEADRKGGVVQSREKQRFFFNYFSFLIIFYWFVSLNSLSLSTSVIALGVVCSLASASIFPPKFNSPFFYRKQDSCNSSSRFSSFASVFSLRFQVNSSLFLLIPFHLPFSFLFN